MPVVVLSRYCGGSGECLCLATVTGRAEGSLAASLATLLAAARCLVLTPDPTPLSCCRVPLPCSGSPYARRLRTSPHYYYYSTTRTVRPFIHERTAPPRDLGPLITDPLRSPSPSPVNVLHVTRGNLPCVPAYNFFKTTLTQIYNSIQAKL